MEEEAPEPREITRWECAISLSRGDPRNLMEFGTACRIVEECWPIDNETIIGKRPFEHFLNFQEFILNRSVGGVRFPEIYCYECEERLQMRLADKWDRMILGEDGWIKDLDGCFRVCSKEKGKAGERRRELDDSH